MMARNPIRSARYVRYDTIRLDEKPLRRSGLQALPYRYGRYSRPTERGTLVPSMDRIVSFFL